MGRSPSKHTQNIRRIVFTILEYFSIGEMDRAKIPDLENDANPTKSSVASQYERCIYTFSQLYERLESTDHDHDVLSSVEEEIGRFRVWAAQTGAHRSGRVSLDYRLREAPHVHSQVSELIGEIQEDLENGTLLRFPGIRLAFLHAFFRGEYVIELH